MDRVGPTLDDQVVFLGDYIDRGPASAGVINYLIEFGNTLPTTIFLRGNHEQMFSDYLDGHDPALFLMNGGVETLNSYHDREQWPIPSAHHAFLAELKNYYETEKHIFVHAGLRPGIPLAGQSDKDLLWIRQEFLRSNYDWGKVVVYGHTPRNKPLLTETRIGLDSGCVYGRKLTCCDVLTGQLWQA